MRIVSLLPSATEILFAIGAGPMVVGVTHECDFPLQARELPKLTSSALPASPYAGDIDRHVRRALHAGSSLYHLDAELLERLEPDLILTQELCQVCAVSYDIVQRAVRRMRGDPRIISLEPASLEEVYQTIAAVGRLAEASSAASALIAELRRRERSIRAAVSGGEKRRTFVLEWTQPPMEAGHWTPDLVALAGGEAILANPHADAQRLEWEAVVDAQPDAIIVAPCGLDIHATARAVDALERVPQWRMLRAVEAGQVALVDGNAYVNRPGPRLLESAEIFAAVLHAGAGVYGPADGWRWLNETRW